MAEALHARGLDDDDITTVLHRLNEAHSKSREVHLPNNVAEDILPGHM